MIQPTKGHIYVRREKVEEKTTAGGIILASEILNKENYDKITIKGEVLAIGEGVGEVGKGDVVWFPRYEAWPLEGNNSKKGDEFFVAEKFVLAKQI